MNRRWVAVILSSAAAGLLLLWLTRVWLVTEAARGYFRQHGVESGVEIRSLGLAGVSGRFALGPQDAPDVSAERVELRFDPLRWLPRVIEVRLVNPVIRARLDEGGRITLPSLQVWIDSLARQKGHSQFISDDMAVSLTGLRALLSTPGGAAELDGDIRLVQNHPIFAALHLRPGAFSWHGSSALVKSACLDFDRDTARLHFAGNIRSGRITLDDIIGDADTKGLKWNSGSVSAASSHLVAVARRVNGAAMPALDVTAGNIFFSGRQARADIRVTGNAAFGGLKIPGDRALAEAVIANLAQVKLRFAGHVALKGNNTSFALLEPLVVTGARGGILSVPLLKLEGSPVNAKGAAQASLAGGGLPALTLALQNLAWVGDSLTTDAALKARFNYDMLRGAEIAASGTLSWREGQYAFTPSVCALAHLAAFHPGASDIANSVEAEICPTTGKPMIYGTGTSWTFKGTARRAAAGLPLANAKADSVSAGLDFDGQGGDFRGKAVVTAARLSDNAASPRFKPVLASGFAALDTGMWHGKFVMTDIQKKALAEITFTHAMVSGAGAAHLSAAGVTFEPGKLQPEDVSPLLTNLRRAEGVVDFDGDIAWTRGTITSRGTLAIDSLDFMTPLGKAHALKTTIAFTSLLPPITAQDQGLTISRIDWTLPLTAVDVRFAFSPAALRIEAAATDIALGHVALEGFTINPADPSHITGAAQLSSIALSSLIGASNLGAKVKLEGKVSGRVPFALTSEGFRITNGHIAADGPGRLSVNRSLWMQGEAALSSNAVQGFAYQALENLAFDSMTADLNSIVGGRLQIVFHIKGHSDPPVHQTADVAIADILDGTAMYKPILLPSATPIDLTLDTSLNFDELLKSYAEAWSKSLSPMGTSTSAPGVKP